ncbi:glycosyltransferase [Ideonella margarita]|uniref:Glycosyltransferase n=1 Tax=Ideonella margarita TaxID=2984191 RepID=A0ABU9C180_9BURK
MNVVVATLGSRGDLHPFLAIARAMHEQGHKVHVLSQESHRVEVESQGLRFIAIATHRDYERTLAHPDLWHPIRGFGVLWRHLAVPAIGPTMTALAALRNEHGPRLTVLASPMVVGARLAAELDQVRLITGHTAPQGIRSHQHPMYVGGYLVPSWVGDFGRAALWRLIDQYKLDPLARSTLGKWRTQLGLPALEKGAFAHWIHSPELVIGLFDARLGELPTDWRTSVEMTGFPLYEAHRHNAVPTELLPPGPIDVVLYGGPQGHPSRSHIEQLGVQAAARGLHTLLIGTAPSGEAPGRLKTMPTVDMPSALDQARLLVHHGGIGTAAQALAANCPQLIIPAAYDQHDNSYRLNGGLQPAQVTLEMLIAKVSGPRQSPLAGSSGQYSRPGAPNRGVLRAAALIADE